MARNLHALAGLVCAGLLGSCVGPQTADNGGVCAAYRATRSHVEVVAAGTVARVFGVTPGRSSPHEGFLMKLDSGCDLIVRVEANTDFTGAFALARGDRVTVKGEYEYYGRGGVIHWTHRDPRNHHEGGYIQIAGKMYD